tara:strand:- start:365 stop:1465 length:1101 start_codon:yes stop_codon:yes gene_type:complete
MAVITGAAIIGFAIQQLGIRAVPVLLRTGQTAMRYFATNPGSKGKTVTELLKKVLGRNNVVDDIGSLTAKVKNNPVVKILDPKKLSMSERNLLMEKTYRDSARILQKTNPSLNAKLAKDIEVGFGGKFDKIFSNRNFILGDRTAVTVAKTTEKIAKAPKQLPKPDTLKKIPDIQKAPSLIQTEAKAAAEIAKARVSAGMGIPARETLKKIPKVDRSQIVKLERAQRKIKSAAQGEGTGPVIAEGLSGETTLASQGVRVSKEAVTKPAWWQGIIPSWLRVGGKAYEGAYPGAVSGTKILEKSVGAGGMLFAGSILHEGFKDLGLEIEGPPEMTTEQLMSELAEEYKNSYNPTITKDSTNVVLPSAVE